MQQDELGYENGYGRGDGDWHSGGGEVFGDGVGYGVYGCGDGYTCGYGSGDGLGSGAGYNVKEY